jgi:lipoprotein-anchoring transpeptidase ErfK/SrfK
MKNRPIAMVTRISAVVAVAFFASVNVVFAAAAAATGAAVPKNVALWQWSDFSKQPSAEKTFAPFVDGNRAGSIAAHDLGNDGVDEIVVGSGFGVPSKIRVFRADGTEIFSFAPFDPTMLQGVSVAAGDIDGDGKAEIVVGTGPGADAHISVFDNHGKPEAFAGSSPFGDDFRGGVSVAVADVEGDGKDDIIAAAGPTGGPRIKIFRADGTTVADFFAFDDSETVGLNIAAGDLNGDGKAEIVVALAGGSAAYVREFSGTGTKVGEFLAMGDGFKGGVNLAVGDVNGDGLNRILVVPSVGGAAQVHAYDAHGKLLGTFPAYDKSYGGGSLLAVGRFGVGKKPSLVTVPEEPVIDGRPDLAQYIDVSVAEQRMRVFAHGQLVRTALVATGIKKYPTPLGDFSILAKPLTVNYTWSYGPDNPDNYAFGLVMWNLRFGPHVYLHYAPWRKVFGVRGSHGCVNLTKADAQWLYAWADIGATVTVQP